MADEEVVRNETEQTPRDGQVTEGLIVLGYDHKGFLSVTFLQPIGGILAIAMMRRMTAILERGINFQKPSQIVLATGNVPRNEKLN